VNTIAVPGDGSWFVPIAYTTKSSPTVSVRSLAPKFWIAGGVYLVSHAVKSTAEWFLINPDAQSKYDLIKTQLTVL
jgi:hypothetical protein